MKAFIFIIFIFLIGNYYSQTTYIFDSSLDGQTISTCSGTFYDEGGSTGDYSSYSDYTVTFCATNSTDQIRLDFSNLYLETGYDQLEFFDGSSISSPSMGIIDFDDGSSVSIQSSGQCLTITFSSDVSTEGSGWEGVISCITPCDNPVSSAVVSSGSSPVNRACLNESFSFDGASSTPGTGFSIVSYDWDFGDGNSASGVSQTHSYSSPGEYTVQLTVTDNNGCVNNNLVDLVVQVGTVPTFTGTTADLTTCSGSLECLDGFFTPTQWVGNPPPQNTTAVLALPDGSGVCYEQGIAVTGFTGINITSAADIESISAELNHTWAGDISIEVECPTGQVVSLFNNDGTWNTPNISSENFGDAANGVSWTYEFEETGSTIDDWGAANPSATTDSNIPAGSYASEQSFAGFIGCPVNGTWTIRICDLYTSDDGEATSWSLDLNSTISNSTFTPSIGSNCDSTLWSGSTPSDNAIISSTSTDCNQVCVTPSSGSYDFVYSVTDNFACSYDTTITVTVDPNAPVIDNFADQSVCDSYTLPAITGTNISANAAFYTATSAGGTQYLTGSSFTTIGTHTIYVYDESAVSPNCSNEQSFQLTVTASPSITGTLSVCEGNTSQLTGTGTPDGTSPWTSSDVTVATVDNTGLVTSISAGTTDITYLNDGGCSVTVTFTVTSGSTITGTLSVCEGVTSQLSGSGTPDATTPWVSSDVAVATVDNLGLVTALSSGTTDITYLNDTGCSITETFTVSGTPTISGTLSICVSSTTQLSGSGTPDGTTPWVSSDIAVATVDNLGLITALSSGTTDITYLNDAGCSVSETVTVTALNTVALPSSTPSLCENTTLTPITHATTGATGIGTPIDLPSGVSASWSGNVITISGTPTSSVGSPFNYSIPLTGGCGSVNATGTIIVNSTNTVSTASSSPSVCENSAITPITHTTTGATGIGTATGLPAGVTATFSSGTITVSGTPTTVGSYTYTIPLTGGCGSVNATGSINVDPRPSGISITTNCSGSTLDNVTVTSSTSSGTLEYSIDNSTWQSSNVFSSLSSGSTYSFYVRTVGTSCSSSLLNQIINCNCSAVSDNTISSDQTICTGTAPSLLDGMTSTVAPVVTFTYQWQESTDNSTWVDISGEVNEDYQPGTLLSSTYFRRLVKMAGCADDISNSVFITVNNTNTVGLASSSPVVCENTAITSITHTTTGATGIGAAIGLPSGVSAVWAADVITLSGTPTLAGNYSYTIPLTGGCGSVEATGIIQVDGLPTAVSITTNCTGASVDNVTVNSSVSSGTLEYSIDNVSWQSSNVFTGISSGSTSTFYVRTVGTSCQTDNSLLVDCSCSIVSDNTISSDQTICTGTAPSLLDGMTSTVAPVVSFTYQWQESTDNSTWVDISGEVNEDYQPGTLTSNTYFRRLVKMAGCADDISNSVLITLNNSNTVGLASNSPVVCVNTAITSITHSTTSATGIVDDGVDGANGLPPGVSATWASDVITINGTPSVSGSFSYTIPLTGGCGTVDATGTIQVNNLPTIAPLVGNTGCVGDLDWFVGTTDHPVTPWISSDPSIADIDALGFITSVSPGTVDVTYTDINGCSTIDQYTVYGNPIANAGVDQILTCSNTLIQLDGTNASNVVGDTYYQWYDQSAAQVGSLNPQVDISIPGTYYLGVVYMYDPINTLYCYAEDTIEITQDITTLNLQFLPINDLCENDLDIDLSLNVDIAGGTWSSSGIGTGNLPIFSPSTEGVNSYTVDYTVVNPVNDCSTTEQISFAVNPVPIIDISVDALDGCVPLSVALTDNNYSVGDVVNWNTDNKDYLNQSSFSHTYNIDGNYDITISKANSYGCISSATFVDTISVNPLPVASFELDNYELSTYNSKAVITNNSTDGEWYYWVYGDGIEDSTQVLDTEHIFPNDIGGDYIMRLIVKSSDNCFDTTYTRVKVNEELIYYIPNSFTPNGDNYNQEFKPVFTSGVDLDDYSLLIYNRWGELIFESHDMNIGWDGLFSSSDIEVNSGVFIWKIIFKTKDNENLVQEVGALNLIK